MKMTVEMGHTLLFKSHVLHVPLASHKKYFNRVNERNRIAS